MNYFMKKKSTNKKNKVQKINSLKNPNRQFYWKVKYQATANVRFNKVFHI